MDFSLIDHFEKVSDKDAAIYTREIVRQEGIFVGNSAGSAIAGLLQLKDNFKKDDVVVVIFHDHGTRYLAKMFNDEWMRDRGFLTKEKPRALDLIRSHQHLKLITLDAGMSVHLAVDKMSKYNISQIPVTRKNEYVGSINDSQLFSKLLEKPELRNQMIETVMQAAFPFVDGSSSIEEVSRKITRENTAVLVKDETGTVHIITKHDIIEAIG